MTKVSPNDVDALVGRRVKEARHRLRMTSGELAKQVGISTQQVSKIERNRNRINAGQLWLFARCLGQPVDWFFEAPGHSVPELRSVRKLREFVTIVTALEPSQMRLIANATKLLVTGKPEELIHPADGARKGSAVLRTTVD